MQDIRIRSSLAAFVLLVTPATFVSGQQSGAGWTDYLGGPDGSHYSPLTQISPANVNNLEIAWSYEAGQGATFSFCPLVVGNVAYVAAKQGALVALDASTGKELWTHRFPGKGRSGAIGSRGANYWESQDRSDRRILVNSGGFMYALDARTGELVDSFADHGRLDLKTGIDRAPISLASRTPGRILRT